MKRLTHQIIFYGSILVLSLNFSSCSKDKLENVDEPVIGAHTPTADPMTLSVASIQEDNTDPDFYKVTFHESAAIYQIARQDADAIERLESSLNENLPILIETDADELNTIVSVRAVSSETLQDFREMQRYKVDSLSKEELLSPELSLRANDVVPSLTKLNQIFNALRNMSVVNNGGYLIYANLNYPGYGLGRIPFQYAHDGCFARAHAMSWVIENNFGYTSYKRFILAKNSNRPLTVKATKWGNRGCCITWSFHVAPVVKVRIGNRIEIYVLDPSIFDEPVPVAVWDNSMIGDTRTTCQNNSRYNYSYERIYTISAAYNFQKRPDGSIGFIADYNYWHTNSTLNDYRYRASCY